MSLWKALTGELIDIIEWNQESQSDVIAWRFPRHDNEIKNGAKLIVREGQQALFVNMGQLADVFVPGMYELKTQNLPILSTLMGWKYGFDSPFKAEVYFVATRRFTDLKWGTANPIMMRDADFGAVRLRAFGAYAVKITDPGLFIKDIVGTDGLFQTEEISEYLRDLLVQGFSNALGSAKIPALDLAANYRDLSSTLTAAIQQDFATHGLTLSRFIINNISVPPEVEAALDKRAQMGAIGDLNRFTQFQVANSIPDAAKNPGGMAAMGVGLGAGVAMGGQYAQAMNQAYAQPAPAPAAAAGGGEDIVAKLGQLKKLLDGGLIEKAEYDEKKKELLSKM